MQQNHSTLWTVAIFSVVVLTIVGISSCRRTQAPLPEGIQNIEGTLIRADLSLTRRGSHMLIIEGEPTYYVESSIVNLHRLENREVELQGMFEQNTDPKAFPVLVVQKVLQGGEEELRSWTMPSFGITLSVPRSWQGTINTAAATFTASGSSTILSILRETSDSLPFDFRTLSGSSSSLRISPLIIDGKKAVQVSDEAAQTEAIHIDIGEAPGTGSVRQILSMRFVAPLLPEAQWKELIDDIVATVRFRTPSSAPKSASHTSASGSAGSASPSQEGKPCGGPAGILCPGGYYCQVTDRESDIGVCKKL